MISVAFRFCAVGLFVFCVDFSALWLFHKFLSDLVAVSLAYFVAVSVHFYLNKFWTFGSRAKPPAAELARYGMTVFACWLCTITVVSLALWFLSRDWPVVNLILKWVPVSPVFIAKFAAIPLSALLSFALLRWFVFRSDQLAPDQARG